MKMKNNGSLKLSFLYFKHNKKRYINIILLFSLSFIIFISTMFFLVSYSRCYKDEFNENKIYLSANMSSDNDEYYEKIKEIISSDDGVEESNEYTCYSFKYEEKTTGGGFSSSQRITYYPKISIDNLEKEYPNTKTRSDYFYLYDNPSNLFSKSEYSYANKNDMDLILSGNIDNIGDNDVVVSNKICNLFNITVENIIGKRISYTLYLEDGDRNELATIISDYTIKAVYNEEAYLSLVSRNDDEVAPLMIFNSCIKSVFDTYCSYNKVNKINYVNIFFKDFDRMNSSIETYYDFYEDNKLTEDANINILATYLLDQYLKNKDLFSLSIKSLIIISILIFVIMILNLFNISVFINKKRLKFLNMCQNIGFSKLERNKFILYESMIIFGIISIVSFIISLAFSIALKYVFNKVYLRDLYISILNLRYYFFVFVIFIIVIFGFIVLFSYIINLYLNHVKEKRLL